MRNLRLYGYGIKSFGLSMVETAIELTDGRITGNEIRSILHFIREMLYSPVELLDGTLTTIRALSGGYRKVLITKGDLFEQESKIARSGIADEFDQIEILSDKTPESYRAMLARSGIDPQRFLMVGNSMRSDILPVLELGGYAVYIPYHVTWAHELAEHPGGGYDGQFFELEQIGELPALLRLLAQHP
jgi:putative hydrolase of the HAD superfamily